MRPSVASGESRVSSSRTVLDEWAGAYMRTRQSTSRRRDEIEGMAHPSSEQKSERRLRRSARVNSEELKWLKNQYQAAALRGSLAICQCNNQRVPGSSK